ncbi:MAG: hypothetical protein ACLGIM_04640, partial [Alphaproteobacteria bacterium]
MALKISQRRSRIERLTVRLEGGKDGFSDLAHPIVDRGKVILSHGPDMPCIPDAPAIVCVAQFAGQGIVDRLAQQRRAIFIVR